MRTGLLLVFLMAVGGLLGLTSCGGSDDPLTESEYRAAGNELCADWAGKVDELSAEAASNSDQDIVEFSNEVGRLADDYTERLLDLSAPESLAADRAAIQARIDEYDAIVAQVPESEADFDAITDAGNALTEALGNLWSACRAR